MTTGDIVAIISACIGGIGVLVGLVAVLYGRHAVKVAEATVALATSVQREERLLRNLDALARALAGLALLKKFEPQVRSGQVTQVYHAPHAQVVQAMAALPKSSYPAVTALLDEEGYAHMSELLPAAIAEVGEAIDATNNAINGR